VLVTGASVAPPVLSGDVLTAARIWAAVIALAATLAIQIPLDASHPPAAGRALLVALGGIGLTTREMAVLATGILLVAVPERWLADFGSAWSDLSPARGGRGARA
jgi:hypothetical protein